MTNNSFITFNALLGYECINKRCDRGTGVENIDWGHYTSKDNKENIDINGNCQLCKDICSKNVSCEAVQCGGSSCNWWRNGKCNDATELTPVDTSVLTCLKSQYFSGKKFS